jgi:hypothetical protein
MSIKNFVPKLAGVAAVGLAVGICGMWAFKNKVYHGRKPASVAAIEPMTRLMPLGKHLAVISTKIEKPEQIPDNEYQEVTLTGYIYVRQNINSDVTIHWTLPEGVRVVEGQVTDSFAGVQVGQAIKVQIAVVGFSSEYQKMISLQAFAYQDSIQFGNSSMIVTRPGETWEAQAPDLKASAEAQLQENAVQVQ